MLPPPPKILLVTGFSRNGSTLIGRILAEAEGAVCIGETQYIWRRGLVHGVECGCGLSFRACPFWSAVGEQSFGGWDAVDVEMLARWEAQLNRFRFLPFHLVPHLWPKFSEAIEGYLSHMESVYDAVLKVSGSSLVVETSKDPCFASMLNRISGPRFDVRMVHLVRDSRAVAYSWTRKKKLPNPIGTQDSMSRFRPTVTAAKWDCWNVATQAFPYLGARYMRLFYENFVAEPKLSLEALTTFAEHDFRLPAEILDEDEVLLGEHHIFSGNPMRASFGRIPIRLDDEWRAKLPGSAFKKVTLITWPLLSSYGYPIPRGSDVDSTA
jgi:hypothetical protein